MPYLVCSVNVGRAGVLRAHGRELRSAIRKQPVEGRVALHPLGLEGDEQVDRSIHGGPAKALYAYPVEHYAFWQTVRAQARVAAWDEPLAYGALGENLTLAGVRESEVFIGDRLRFADCELVVTGPRLPCFKLDAAMGFPHAANLMAQSAWCGFYLAVHRPGSLQAGESFEWIAGPREIGVQEIFRVRMQRAGR